VISKAATQSFLRGEAGLGRNGCKVTAGLSKPGRSIERYGKEGTQEKKLI
jgi:hypothetical protein